MFYICVQMERGIPLQSLCVLTIVFFLYLCQMKDSDSSHSVGLRFYLSLCNGADFLSKAVTCL